MAEYGREQRNQLSRVVANNGAGSRQLKGIVDNRPFFFHSSKPILQRSKPMLSFEAIFNDEGERARRDRENQPETPPPIFTFGVDFMKDHLHNEDSNSFQIEGHTLNLNPDRSSNGTQYSFSVEMWCYRDRIISAGGESAAAMAPKLRCLTMGYINNGVYQITHLENEVR